MSLQTVLILEPESSGLELIPTAVRLGFDVHIFDHRALEALGNAARDAVAAGQASYRTVDTRSAQASIAAATELAAHATIVAVVPGFEYTVPTAASVAAALRLPGLAPAAADALREKDRMKDVLAVGGAPVAKGVAFDLSDDESVLLAAVALVGFPAVVKPVDGSGSLLVRRIDSLAQLRDFITLVRSGLPDSLGRPIGARLLLETYVSGPEFSIEGFVQSSTPTVVAITQKLLGAEPHFAELGHIVDAQVDPGQRAALEKVTHLAVQALSLRLGVFHLEVRLSAAGPVIMEIGARLAGDRIPTLVREVHGYDLGEVLIRCHSGLPVGPPPLRAEGLVAAARFLTVDEESVLRDPDLLVAEISQLPGCLEMVLTCPRGATLQPVTDWRQRFGRAVVVAADRPAMHETLTRIDHLVRGAVQAVGSS